MLKMKNEKGRSMLERDPLKGLNTVYILICT